MNEGLTKRAKRSTPPSSPPSSGPPPWCCCPPPPLPHPRPCGWPPLNLPPPPLPPPPPPPPLPPPPPPPPRPPRPPRPPPCCCRCCGPLPRPGPAGGGWRLGSEQQQLGKAGPAPPAQRPPPTCVLLEGRRAPGPPEACRVHRRGEGRRHRPRRPLVLLPVQRRGAHPRMLLLVLGRAEAARRRPGRRHPRGRGSGRRRSCAAGTPGGAELAAGRGDAGARAHTRTRAHTCARLPSRLLALLPRTPTRAAACAAAGAPLAGVPGAVAGQRVAAAKQRPGRHVSVPAGARGCHCWRRWRRWHLAAPPQIVTCRTRWARASCPRRRRRRRG